MKDSWEVTQPLARGGEEEGGKAMRTQWMTETLWR